MCVLPVLLKAVKYLCCSGRVWRLRCPGHICPKYGQANLICFLFYFFLKQKIPLLLVLHAPFFAVHASNQGEKRRKVYTASWDLGKANFWPTRPCDAVALIMTGFRKLKVSGKEQGIHQNTYTFFIVPNATLPYTALALPSYKEVFASSRTTHQWVTFPKVKTRWRAVLGMYPSSK